MRKEYEHALARIGEERTLQDRRISELEDRLNSQAKAEERRALWWSGIRRLCVAALLFCAIEMGIGWGLNKYASGENLLQKIPNGWPLMAAGFVLSGCVGSRVIGRKRIALILHSIRR